MSRGSNPVAFVYGTVFEGVAPAYYLVAARIQFDVGTLVCVECLLVIFEYSGQRAVGSRVDIHCDLVDLLGEDIGCAIADITEAECHFSFTVVHVLSDTAGHE